MSPFQRPERRLPARGDLGRLALLLAPPGRPVLAAALRLEAAGEQRQPAGRRGALALEQRHGVGPGGRGRRRRRQQPAGDAVLVAGRLGRLLGRALRLLQGGRGRAQRGAAAQQQPGGAAAQGPGALDGLGPAGRPGGRLPLPAAAAAAAAAAAGPLAAARAPPPAPPAPGGGAPAAAGQQGGALGPARPGAA